MPLELAAYGLLALGLAGLLWSHVGEVDGFYLDEWFYVHGAQHIAGHLPGGLVESIPEWNRGPQRLYSTLLALMWGPLSPSPAYTLSHVVNVLLLVSAIVPAALLARRLIDVPLLRVLAVALGVAIPWLTIGSHLLTESLAFPLYLWAVYAMVRCAEEPSVPRQAGALGAIAALALCRLNLAFVIAVLFIAVIAAELMRRRAERHEPLGGWLRRALRREALVVAAAVVAGIAAVVLAVRGGSGVSAHYASLEFDTTIERLFGDGAADTRRTMLTYARALVVGSFVFPVAIGLGVALAGICGRAGRRLVVPSVVALAGLAVVIIVVSTSTVGGAVEERYVMYVYPPIALLAVAGLQQLDRLRAWLLAGSALTLWALMTGFPAAAGDAGNFFAAPAGAFWTRVVQHRLVSLEEDLFGWMFIGPTGWLLVAVGLGAMLVFVRIAVARGRPGLITPVLAVGLALCAVAQVAVLDYGFKQELHGTAEVPGGRALSAEKDADRETWLDDRLPAQGEAAVMPGVISSGARWGGTEVLQFWNEGLDATVALPWNGTVAPVPPGYVAIWTELGPDGLARWAPRPQWLAAHRDDPRAQFPGTIVARSPVSAYALYRTARSDRAMWTSAGLEPDGAVLERRPVTMTLDRDAAGSPSGVVMTLRATDGARAPVRWRLTARNRTVAAGRLRPASTKRVRLTVPDCAARQPCAPVAWTLRASGREVPKPLPAYGAPGAPRPVLLEVVAAHISRRSAASGAG